MNRKRGVPVLLELIRGQASPGSAPSPTRPVLKPIPTPQTAAGATPRPTRSVGIPANPGMAMGAAGETARPSANPSLTAAARPAPVAVEPKGGVRESVEAARPSRQLSPWSGLGRFLGGSTDGEGPRGVPAGIWYAVAGVLIVSVLVWWLAFNMGHARGRGEGEQLVRQMAGDDAKGLTTLRDPLQTTQPVTKPGPATDAAELPKAPDPTPTKAAPPPSTRPTTAPTTDAAVTTLQPGFNYLVVATLMRKDAEEAAAYLKANGLDTAMVAVGGGGGATGKTGGGVDPKGNPAKDDRLQYEVLVLRGLSSARVRAGDAEIGRLETQVKNLGRKWKAENRRAPTDFAQTFWRKHRGP